MISLNPGKPWNAGDRLPLRFTDGPGVQGQIIFLFFLLFGLTLVYFIAAGLENPDFGDWCIVGILLVGVLWGGGKHLFEPHSQRVEILEDRVYCHEQRLLGANTTIRARLSEFVGIEQLSWLIRQGSNQSQNWHGVRLKHPRNPRLNIVLYRSPEENLVRNQAEKFCRMLGLDMVRAEADGSVTHRKLEDLDRPLQQMPDADAPVAGELPTGSKVRQRRVGDAWVIEMPTNPSPRPHLGRNMVLAGLGLCLLFPVLKMVTGMNIKSGGYTVMAFTGSIPLILGLIFEVIRKYGQEVLTLDDHISFESGVFGRNTLERRIHCAAVEELRVQQTKGPGRVLVCFSDAGEFRTGVALSTEEFDWLHARLLEHIRSNTQA